MTDLMNVAFIVVLFALAAGFVFACERLK